MSDIQAVVNVLNELRDTYEEIYALSLQKKAAIVESNADLVGSLTAKEWTLIKKATKLEDGRVLLVEEIAKENGKDQLNMSELIEISGEHASDLRHASQTLVEILKKQSEINELNKQLLEVHFDYINFIVDVYSHREQPSNIYGSSGLERDFAEQSLGLLDSEV